MVRTDIYGHERQFAKMPDALAKSGLSGKNKEAVERFTNHCMIRGMSKCRLLKYYYALKYLAEFLGKDFEEATKADIEKVVAKINGKEDWSVATKHDAKVMLKRFYKWLYCNDEEYPKEVKWIKSKIKRTDKKLPNEGDLLSEEDVLKAVQVARHSRDKALIITLYESGCRVGEIASMRIKDVVFDKFGTMLSVTGKTGPRNVRIIAATSHLATWINNHPLHDDRESPLWVSIGGRNYTQRADYDTIVSLIDRAFRQAGIPKRHNPHLFRHSRATFLANHLTEFQMNQYFGWVQGSDMPSTYVHLSGKAIDNAILEVNGMKKKEEAQQPKMSIACKRCDAINVTGSVFCNKCGGVVDIATAIRMEEEEKERNTFQRISNEALTRIMKEKPELVMEFIKVITQR